jgi:hypothetical protein
VCWDVGAGKKGIVGTKWKVYSCSSRARDLTKHISFFIRLIGLEGYSILTLGYRTHMTIYFEHLERVLGVYD